MSVEPLFLQLLANDTQLSSMLARYLGDPAIFYRIAPGDTDPNWVGGAQYPRIVYDVDRDTTVGDILSGRLHVYIYGREDYGTPINQIFDRVVQLLNDAAVNDTANEGLVVTKLTDARPFSGEDPNMRVIGIDTTFQLRALPNLVSGIEPDPVLSFQAWTNNNFMGIIQVAPNPTWSPTDQLPAVYSRLTLRQSRPGDHTWSVKWMTAYLDVHVFAPNLVTRQRTVTQLASALRDISYMCMDDGSFMDLLNIDENMNASPYREGQIKLVAHYGELTRQARTYFDTPGGQSEPSYPWMGTQPNPWAPSPVNNTPQPNPWAPLPIPTTGPTMLYDTDTGQPLDHPHLDGQEIEEQP